MMSLSETEVREFLSANLREWSFSDNYIIREIRFKTFIEAFSFMTAVALEAEKMDHHPEWNNVYNSVLIKLSTHEANGITPMDFQLAQIIERIYRKYE